MKKLFAMFVVAGMVAFVACGPSAEVKEQQRIADSTRVADSNAAVMAAQEQAAADTAVAVKARAEADSIAKLPVKK
ncbi:MAG: hypothetical protein Q7U54_06590 [Bacteroidales bacterium]|jgi:hypothetical protein|nr:hypothetical protein [Bacteroidales bacterium]